MRWMLLLGFVVTVPAFVAAVAWWSRRRDAVAVPRDAAPVAEPARVVAPDGAYAPPPRAGAVRG